MLELDATITPAPAATKIGLVEKKSFTTPNFHLRSGAVLAQVTIAYETYGRLATDGRNAILVAHGYTNNHHAAGRYAEADPQPGWWDGVIGPGKAIDTNHFFVVSSNMLGSSYGSTNPSSPNPAGSPGTRARARRRSPSPAPPLRDTPSRETAAPRRSSFDRAHSRPLPRQRAPKPSRRSRIARS